MDIQILAPIPQILVANRSVDVGSPKARLILAVLAESVGRVVPTAILIEHVWGQHPPEAVQGSLYSYASRIRTRLRAAGAEATIVNRSQGYALETDPIHVDWHRARRWSDQARKLVRQGENDRAAALLEDALDLWQEEPLTEFGGLWADSLRRSAARTHTRILGYWAGARIALGQHDEVLDRLDDHPRDETLTLHHMRALAARGRHTEAVECYTELREHTLAELGSEPNPRVRSLFQRILTEEGQEDEAPGPGLTLVQERGRPPEVIDTLQADVADFLGREEELENLLTSVRGAGGRTLVQAVTGIGGAGKTTLAVHAAHILRDEFDVRLQTDLSDVGADQVLFRLLQMLGVPGGSIPTEREARVAMWRNQIAGRRVLLLLDNASHHGQVAPAVPGTPGSVVLVTSRGSLSGLDGARRVNLRTLDDEDAAQMFAAFSGRSTEDTGMDRVVGLTGGLPIALRVASAQLRPRLTWSLDYLAGRLERQGRAAAKGADWEAIAVFASSFEQLSPENQRTFLCVGLHPTPVVPDHAVAASVGYWEESDASLAALLDVHLLEEVSPGRYRMHDLVRKFAHQRAARVMSDRDRREVERRIFEYYLATADNADRAARPGRRRTERPTARGAATQTFDTPREAREWFADYFPALESVIEHARSRGFTEYVARIPLAMAGLLESSGPWDRAERLFRAAVAAWREMGDPVGLADGLYEVALMRLNLKALEGTEGLLHSAMELWGAEGKRENIPYARDQIAMFHAEQGNHVRAVSGYKVALEEFQLLGDQRGVAKVFNHLALSHSNTGNHDLASSFFLVAKQIYQALGDRQMEATMAMNLFRLRFGKGQHREARAMNERCRQVYEENGDVLGVASTYWNRGLLELYLNRSEEALDCFRVARRGFWSAGDVSSTTRSMAAMGEALVGLGRLPEAEEVVRDGLEQARAQNLAFPESPLLRALGDVYLARHLRSQAREMYEGSLSAAARSAAAVNEGLACFRLGDLSSLEGDPGQALVYWRQSVRVLERVPTPYLAHVRSRIEWSLYVQGQIAS